MAKIMWSICLILISSMTSVSALIPRYAAIVMDAHSGEVLHQESADQISHPASLTKMASLYMVFEALKTGRLKTNTMVRVSKHASQQIPCKLGLKPGEYVSVETIVKGMVTKSANDASAAIAEHLAGSEAIFAEQMTRRMKKLGMHRTTFKNASGVPNTKQITTARDMAILSRALYLHFPKEYKHFRLKSFHHRGQLHRNHNHLLGVFPGLDGIKTGWIASSGSNLAASAVRKGPNNEERRLIAVVLGGTNRHWRDRRVAELLEANFQKIGLSRHKLHVQDAVLKVEQRSKYKGEQDGEKLVNDFLRQGFIETNSLQDPSDEVSQILDQGLPEEDLSCGVQFGSYRSLKEAKLRAKKMRAIVRAGIISTPRIKKGKKTYYGARLLEISQENAEKICKTHPTKNECRILAG